MKNSVFKKIFIHGNLKKKQLSSVIPVLCAWLEKYDLDYVFEPDLQSVIKKSGKNQKKFGELDESFDLVITFDVLEHLERAKIKKAVKETIRVSSKYVLHKIYTTENLWITLAHGHDPSHLSVFPKKFWQNLFNSFKEITVLKKGILRLPSFFETLFLLKKKV